MMLSLAVAKTVAVMAGLAGLAIGVFLHKTGFGVAAANIGLRLVAEA